MPAAIASAAVLAAGLILLRVYETPIDSALIYLGFLLGYIFVPGCLVYRVLMPDPEGWIRQIALGGGLGYVLLVFAFMLTAAADMRPLLDYYPLIVGVPAAIVVWFQTQRRAGVSPASPAAGSARLGYWVAAVCILAMTYVGLFYFSVSPLPGAQTVTYPQDFSWAIALAADALNHWPMMDPSVSGEPLPYHNFVHVHLASATQVTGLDLPIVFLRLWILPVVVLIVLQFTEAGRSLFGNAATGLVAAGLAFFVGDFGLPYANVFYSFLTSSPSFTFGLIVTLPLLILIGERLRDPRPLTARPGEWILLALFAAGAGGAKVAILPLLIGALAIFGLVAWFRERRFPVTVLVTGLVLVAAQLIYYLLLYRGHSSGLTFDPTAGVDFLKSIANIDIVKAEAVDVLPGVPGLEAFLGVVAVPLALFAFLAPTLAGLVWLCRRRNLPFSPAVAWLFAALVAGLMFLAVAGSEASGNQLYFVSYGLVAGMLLSAEGMRFAWAGRRRLRPAHPRIALLLGGWALVLVVFLAIPDLFADGDYPRGQLLGYSWLALSGALLVLTAYGGLKAFPGALAAVLVAACVMTGLIDVPKTNLEPALSAKAEPVSGYRMTPELYRALIWLREETPDDSVFIVNNQHAIDAGGFATAFDYPAFSERRAFLAGWGYSLRARDAGFARVTAGFNPFADRQRLNDLAFAGDPEATSGVRSNFGVGYALIDRVNGNPPADLEAMKKYGRVVYETPDAVVLKFED